MPVRIPRLIICLFIQTCGKIRSRTIYGNRIRARTRGKIFRRGFLNTFIQRIPLGHVRRIFNRRPFPIAPWIDDGESRKRLKSRSEVHNRERHDRGRSPRCGIVDLRNR